MGSSKVCLLSWMNSYDDYGQLIRKMTTASEVIRGQGHEKLNKCS